MSQRTASRRKWLAAACLLAVFFLCCVFTGVSPALLVRRGGHFADIVTQMFPPDWSYIPRVLPLLWDTIQMSVTGTAAGALLSLLWAPLCARVVPGPRLGKGICRGIIQVLRSFPALILALFATFLFGLSSFSGAFAIGVYTFSIMTRLTYEDLENAPAGAFRALLSMGCGSFSAYVRALLPQILPGYLTNFLYLLEANVRHSAILGYVGAGGIGLLLNEKVSWREYDKVGAILLLLFVTVCLIEQLGTYLTAVVQGRQQLPRWGRAAVCAAFALLFLVSTATLDGPDLSHTSRALLASMGRGLLHPDWSLFFSAGQDGLGYLLLETAAIALVGTAAGAILSLPLVFLNSGRVVPWPAALVFRLLVAAIRSVPFLIYGLIFIRVTGPGSFAGVLTLAMCSVGLLCKRFTQAIDAMDLRPIRALGAMGVPPLPRLTRGMLPQLFAPFLSAALYRFDVNVREASVLGLVGAGGIGAPLIFAMNHYDWSTVSTLSIGLILLALGIDLLSGAIRKRLSL